MTTVFYKGETLATVDNNTKTLLTAGKYCEDDFTLTDVTQGGTFSTIYDGADTPSASLGVDGDIYLQVGS